jgi:SHS2 domain-containing protein
MSQEGFKEVEHTADWALRVWAPDLAGLLRSAAEGMFSLLDLNPRLESGVIEEFELAAADAETLLVSWLEELLFLHELHSQALKLNSLKLIEPLKLKAIVERVPAEKPKKQIKAVTFHQLEIIKRDQLLHTEIVFDV